MNRNTVIRLAMVSAAVFAVFNVSAAVLTVNGNIVAPSCTIAASDVSQTVTLPTVGPSDLLNANNLSPVTFKFDLSDCHNTLNTAAVTLNGVPIASDVPGFTSVIESSGTATNVGIGIIGSTSVGSYPTGPLPVGTLSATAALTGAATKTGRVSLRAQIVPLLQATPVVAGTVVGSATVTFTYA